MGGGKLLTLSCTDCDSRIGHEFDWHAVAEKKMRIWQKGPRRGHFIPEKGPDINILSVWDFEKSIILTAEANKRTSARKAPALPSSA